MAFQVNGLLIKQMHDLRADLQLLQNKLERQQQEIRRLKNNDKRWDAITRGNLRVPGYAPEYEEEADQG